MIQDALGRFIAYTPQQREQSIWAKINKTSKCWEWTGIKDKRAYGRVYNPLTRRQAFAHRVVFELSKGVILPGLVIDHLCRNHGCVNPEHLEAVPQGLNLRRGRNYWREKNHCRRGHPYTGVRNKRGARICKMCHTIASRKHYLKKRGT